MVPSDFRPQLAQREGLMGMKIATRIKSIEGGSKLRGRLRGKCSEKHQCLEG